MQKISDSEIWLDIVLNDHFTAGQRRSLVEALNNVQDLGIEF